MSTRIERIKVWENTIELCIQGKFKDLNPGNSEHFTHNNEKISNIPIEKKYLETEINVLNEDVLVVAGICNALGEKNPMVLNLASFYSFLGGVRGGAFAQEEELGLSSNL